MSSPQNPKGPNNPNDPSSTSATIQSLLESKNPGQKLVESTANQNIQRNFDAVISPIDLESTIDESELPTNSYSKSQVERVAGSKEQEMPASEDAHENDEDQKDTLIFDIKQLTGLDAGNTGITSTNTATTPPQNSQSSDIALDFSASVDNSAHDRSLANLIADENETDNENKDDSADNVALPASNAAQEATPEEAPESTQEPQLEIKTVELTSSKIPIGEITTGAATEQMSESTPANEQSEEKSVIAEIELGEYREETIIELGTKRTPAQETTPDELNDFKIEESLKVIGQNIPFSAQELESSLGISLSPSAPAQSVAKRSDDTQEIDPSLLEEHDEAPQTEVAAPSQMQEFQYRDHDEASLSGRSTDHEPDDDFLAEAARFAQKTAEETQHSLNLQTASLSTSAKKTGSWTSVQSASLSKRAFEDLRKSSEELLHYQEDELVRVQATLRTLREEMTQLNQKCDQLELEKQQLRQHNLDLKSERDELKIEVTLLHKRVNDEIENYQYQLRIVEGKRDLYAERARQLKQELDGVQKNIKINVKTIRQHEQELESQLELLRVDSETQVQHRDQKILELKRTIDTLEFERDSVLEKQQKFNEQQLAYETKLHKLERQLQQVIALISDPGSDPKDPYQAPKKVLERKLRFD